MKIFQKDKLHPNMFLNSGPQHPTAHGTSLRFTNNFNTKSFFSNNLIESSKKNSTHVREFNSIIENLELNFRTSRLIKSSEIFDYLHRDSIINCPIPKTYGL